MAARPSTIAATAVAADLSCNLVVLIGVLSSSPRRNDLPSGDVGWALEITTRDGGSTRSVPAVFDSGAESAGRSRSSRLERVISGLEGADRVVVVGAIRRRFFRAGGATRSRTDVVIVDLARAEDRRGVARVLSHAASVIEALNGERST
jgi:single-strand DNA-binding protein